MGILNYQVYSTCPVHVMGPAEVLIWAYMPCIYLLVLNEGIMEKIAIFNLRLVRDMSFVSFHLVLQLLLCNAHAYHIIKLFRSLNPMTNMPLTSSF